MDFSLTDEQSMLADSVGRFIQTDYTFEKRQKILESDAAFSLDMWRDFAELGLIAVPFAEADGGLDGGYTEMMLLMEQFGRGLVIEPYVANVLLAGGALRRSANAQQRATWLAPLIGGELQAALAFSEPQARSDLHHIATSAEKSADGYIFNGHKNMVLNGDAAELLVLPARTSGGSTDAEGITLFLVPGDTPGLTRHTYQLVDGSAAADIRLEAVTLPGNAVLGDVGTGGEILRAVVDDATLAICAEALGIMQTMHDKTVEYTKNRVQFGVPIGSFQALQHRMVDTLISCEQTRSLLYWCVMLGTSKDVGFGAAINALKHQVGTAGQKTAEEAVQLHGGMGVTWELDIAHYFKRMTAINILFGSADEHLDRYVQSSIHAIDQG